MLFIYGFMTEVRNLESVLLISIFFVLFFLFFSFQFEVFLFDFDFFSLTYDRFGTFSKSSTIFAAVHRDGPGERGGRGEASR